MSIPHQIKYTCQTIGESKKIEVVDLWLPADWMNVVDHNVAAMQTGVYIPVRWDYGTCKQVFMIADFDLSVYLHAYPTGEPQVDLKAGVPFIWNDAHGYFSFLFEEVSPDKLYFANGSQITRFQLFQR